MNKKSMMKSMSLAAVAVMTITSCSHDAWNQTYNPSEQTAYEFKSNFKNVVMGGNDIDANQTWSTAVTTKVTLTAPKTGTLKIYPKNPVGNLVAPLYEGNVTAGAAMTIAIARPSDITTLYAAILDNDGYLIENMSFEASGTEATVRFATAQKSNAPQRAHRALQPSFNFPGDADASKFLAEVPAGVEKLTNANMSTANHWIDDTWTGNVNISGSWDGSKTVGGSLYVKGNCDFSNRYFYLAPNSELYLLEGATLTLNANDAGNLQTNINVYIAKDAKILTSDELKLNNGLHIYNHGTIEAGKLSTNSNSVLVNTGTVTVTTKISVENTLSVIVNNGTITAADLNTAGSGKIENNGSVTISGTTLINSNDNTWVNNGQYHTGNLIYNAASDEVINNCRLTVDEDFNINLGDNPGNGCFKMDAGAGVVTKYFNGGGNWAKNYSTGWSSFNGGPFYVYMGAGAVFEVTETATMNATKADYGFYGPETGDYAVLHAKKIEKGAENQGYEVTYGGNLFVASDDHFANGWSGQYPFIDIKGNAKIAKFGDEAEIDIEATGCNPGYKGKKKKEDPKQYVYFAFEDLGMGDDFDFNDVVVRIGIPNEAGVAQVELCATGGTLETYVYNGATQIGEEVHAEFGWEYGTTYVDDKGNTNKKDQLVTPIKVIGEVTVPEGTSVADLDINIHVTNKGVENVVTRPKTGETPFCVVVSGDEEGKWFWPIERHNISAAYLDFGKWGANWESNPDWYKNPKLDEVVKW